MDLDGTLAHYPTGYDLGGGPWEIGPPIKEMQERVIGWIQHGRDVRIFTARATRPESIPAIKAWCEQHLGIPLPVTCCKDFRMEVLYDDHCVQVETNTGRLIAHGIQLVKKDENELVGTVAWASLQGERLIETISPFSSAIRE